MVVTVTVYELLLEGSTTVDVSERLQAFERLRLPRTGTVQAGARANGFRLGLYDVEAAVQAAWATATVPSAQGVDQPRRHLGG